MYRRNPGRYAEKETRLFARKEISVSTQAGIAAEGVQNEHNLTVQVGTQINLRNPHKSFILYSLCHNPGLRIKVLHLSVQITGFPI